MSERASWLKRAYFGLIRGEHALGQFLLLVIRLYWGGLLVLTGLGKFLHAPMIAEAFKGFGIPYPEFMTYFVATFEFLGGVSLFLGLFARLFSIPLIIIFIVAYATAHSAALLSIFSNPHAFTSQDPFLYLFASLIVLCFGAGTFSIDHYLENRVYQ